LKIEDYDNTIIRIASNSATVPTGGVFSGNNPGQKSKKVNQLMRPELKSAVYV
jgi:hypothetical protein